MLNAEVKAGNSGSNSMLRDPDSRVFGRSGRVALNAAGGVCRALARIRSVSIEWVVDSEQFLRKSNPWALRDIVTRLFEAKERGLWKHPDPAPEPRGQSHA